jgi:hypothetical protein
MNTRKTLLSVLATLAFTGATQQAQAGPYADELTRCLVSSTTHDDKSTLVQWIFAIASLHPDVAALSAATPEARAGLNHRVGVLFTNLLGVSCVKETRDAIHFEGNASIEASFTSLGQIAARELFANPAVTAGMQGMVKEVDMQKLGKALGDVR